MSLYEKHDLEQAAEYMEKAYKIAEKDPSADEWLTLEYLKWTLRISEELVQQQEKELDQLIQAKLSGILKDWFGLTAKTSFLKLFPSIFLFKNPFQRVGEEIHRLTYVQKVFAPDVCLFSTISKR